MEVLAIWITITEIPNTNMIVTFTKRVQIPGGQLGIFGVGVCRPGLQIGTPF